MLKYLAKRDDEGMDWKLELILIPVADVASHIVLGNQVVVGSVNANKRHWYKAGQVLARADRAWLERLISRRVPLGDWQRAFGHESGDVKVVLEFTS